MRLIKMTDYVISGSGWKTLSRFHETTTKYANFLKRPSELGMFIPTDKDGNVLEKPKNYFEWLNNTCNTLYDKDLSKYEQYKEALDRVLFKDGEIVWSDNYSFMIMVNKKQVGYFKGHGNYFLWEYDSIEDLCELGLELTEAAINKLTK